MISCTFTEVIGPTELPFAHARELVNSSHGTCTVTHGDARRPTVQSRLSTPLPRAGLRGKERALAVPGGRLNLNICQQQREDGQSQSFPLNSHATATANARRLSSPHRKFDPATFQIGACPARATVLATALEGARRGYPIHADQSSGSVSALGELVVAAALALVLRQAHGQDPLAAAFVVDDLAGHDLGDALPNELAIGEPYATHMADKASACSRTSRTAASCMSGG